MRPAGPQVAATLMAMTSRTIKVSVAALAISGALLAGCSSSKKDQTPITGSIPPAPTTTTTSTTMATGGSSTTTMAMGGSTTTTAAR